MSRSSRSAAKLRRPLRLFAVYIGYLRKKLDAPFRLNTLRTIRGLGYRLDADV